jgi:hypothetical protein
MDISNEALHLLKLVTGVDISTRPVSKSGRLGKKVIKSRRTAAAAPKRAAFRLSISISQNLNQQLQRARLKLFPKNILRPIRLHVAFWITYVWSVLGGELTRPIRQVSDTA